MQTYRRIEYEKNINAQTVERVYEYYTNPDNIKEAWPRDVVKESESTTPSKNEPGSEMKVKGEYMGHKAEMLLEVAEREPNRKLVTRQTEGPFKRSESSYKNFKAIIITHAYTAHSRL